MTKTLKILTTSILLCAGMVASAQSRQEPRFINDIEFVIGGKSDKHQATEAVIKDDKKSGGAVLSAIEAATSLQLKFAILLDTEVELVTSFSMFRLIDQWLGTPYRLGGSTKKGIDCSAFVQMMYTSLFGLAVPRTCREQYQVVKRIMMNDLKEGDLIFFNTRGGVSHVGIYLQNNKFVHASSSEGVTITDLSDPYWSKRIISAGRYDSNSTARR